MTKVKKLLSLLLAVVLCFSLVTACANGDKDPVDEPSDEATDTVSTTPLVVAYDSFSEKFSPFYADTGYDMDVVNMTQVTLLTTDRSGGIIYNAIEGETTSYNGTDYTYTGPADVKVTLNDDGSTTYNMHIRDDIQFSDGHTMDIDDVIFTYYVLCDPSYVGSTTLNSFNILGLKEYQTQTSTELYDKYAAIFDDNYANGGDYADEVAAQVATAWKADVQAIVDYCVANYAADYAETATGFTAEEVAANDGLKIALAEFAWAYATGINETDGLFYDAAGKSYDLKTTYPTLDEFYQLCYDAYAGDCEAYWAVEAADTTDVYGTARDAFVTANAVNDASYEGAITSIEGINRIDDYTVEVTTSDYSASAIYSIAGIQIAPMHYYGTESLYNYDEDQFGFAFGDLSTVQAKTTQPMGAGPYQFIEYNNKIVYFAANANYYKGAPKTAEIQFIETAEADKVSGITSGTIDIANPTGSKDKFEEIKSANGGEVDGDIITTDAVDNLGYGYIGMNADTVNVGGDPDSDASKDLRKGLATILAVYRDLAIDSYYGDAGDVINYPISNTSWAAPQSSDSDYKVAYSTDVDGNAIYTSDMTADQKYEAALTATIGYLKAAGYTFDEASGKFTAAPEGAKLVYEVLIGADGTGDHPSFTVLTTTSQALATIGITLTVNDLTDSAVLWDRLDAGTQELFCAAWQATIDPDMFQTYHSSGIIGMGGSDSNHYHIADSALDELLLQARTSADQQYRKTVYKNCLDIILDWAVEVPVYQRQNVFIYSTERVNIDTITPDVTTYWSWLNAAELIEMN